MTSRRSRIDPDSSVTPYRLLMSNTISVVTTERAAELVLGQMRDVIGRPEFTTTDDFFACGGDSILAAGVAGRLRRITGIDLPISFVFSHPTAAALGAALAERSQAR